MLAARSTTQCRTTSTKSGALFAERTLAVLPLTHAAEVDDGRARGAVGAPDPGHRRRIDGAPLAVSCEPQPPDVAASLQNVRQRRCKQAHKHPHSHGHKVWNSIGLVMPTARTKHRTAPQCCSLVYFVCLRTDVSGHVGLAVCSVSSSRSFGSVSIVYFKQINQSINLFI